MIDYRNDSSGLWGAGANPVNVHSGIYVITDGTCSHRRGSALSPVHALVMTDLGAAAPLHHRAETIVTTRYFFIYPQGTSSSQSAVADNLRLPEDIYK